MYWSQKIKEAHSRMLDPPDDEPEYECEECGNTEYFTESGDKWEGEIVCNKCGYCLFYWDNLPD